MLLIFSQSKDLVHMKSLYTTYPHFSILLFLLIKALRNRNTNTVSITIESLIFLKSTKLKTVWVKVTKFFKLHVSIII